MKTPSRLQHNAVAQRKEPRLQPPADLPAAQKLIWHATVEALPPEWFALEMVPLLVTYCRHVDRANTIEAALAGLNPVADLDVFDKLTKLAAGESAKILAHGRSMRLTQQSRLKAESAHDRGAAAAWASRETKDDYDGLLA
jgi:hypothetical protein